MGLDLIQSCITRMANCSFSLKGWYISLVTLALTLLIGQGCKVSIIGLVLFGVTTIFWGLDGFFLKMETILESLGQLMEEFKKMETGQK